MCWDSKWGFGINNRSVATDYHFEIEEFGRELLLRDGKFQSRDYEQMIWKKNSGWRVEKTKKLQDSRDRKALD